ncbi:unnamed protein product [Lathyrus sativus]|nr:unnamed protein product [Lathyrus sativus]
MSASSPSVASPHVDDHRISTTGYRNAESLLRFKPIVEIRNTESTTCKHIDDKKEGLRQLVGNHYRDLIDSADSIVNMKSSCNAISANFTPSLFLINFLKTSFDC